MFNFSLNLLIPATVIFSCVIFAISTFFINLRLILLIFKILRGINFFYPSRKRFPITVNCWFCNANTRVPYNNRNSFVCSSCQQFNGFTESGDYNREIPEQHYSKLNASNNFYCQRADSTLSPSMNGLCEGCNRNQEMKIIQLANFKPRCEAKYDEEVEEYRQRLEDSYQLCQQCQRHLKKTLNRVKTKFIGSKISKLVKKGIQLASGSKTAVRDRQVISKLAMLSIFVLSVVNLFKDFNIDINFLRSICNDSLMTFYYHLVALRLTIGDLLMSWTKESELQNLDLNIDAIATSAVMFNALLLRRSKIRLQVVVSMLFWSLKMVLSELPLVPTHVVAVKGIVAVVLIITSVHMLFKSRKSKISIMEQEASFHKIHTELGEESDSEELSQYSDNWDVRSNGYDVRSNKSSIYSPSILSVRDKTILQPARTFPIGNKSLLNSSFIRSDKTLHNSTFGLADVDLLSNRSFSIQKEVSTADRNQVRKDINKLNISGHSLLGSLSTLKDFSSSKNLNPFSLENSRCGSPTPSIASVFSGSHHSQVISPPRLEAAYVGEANASWVAGGYWSSPQKRYMEVNYFKQHPEMSRSSSQSSGLGTIDSDKNSRENSIGHDDVTSVFSDSSVRRRNLFEKPPEARQLFGQSFQVPKSNNFMFNSTANNFRKYRDGNSFFK